MNQPERLIAYKVLTKKDGKLLSYNWGGALEYQKYIDCGLCLVYEEDKLIEPFIKGSKLFVFKTIDAATNFETYLLRRPCDRWELWEVFVDSLEQQPKPPSFHYKDDSEHTNEIWKDGKFVKNLSLLNNHEETWFCNNLRLVKKIEL